MGTGVARHIDQHLRRDFGRTRKIRRCDQPTRSPQPGWGIGHA
jgi:hypothetical protein